MTTYSESSPITRPGGSEVLAAKPALESGVGMHQRVSRRTTLRAVGAASLAAIAAACAGENTGGATATSPGTVVPATGGSDGTSAITTVTDSSSLDTTVTDPAECVPVIPDETGGPFPGDGTNGPNVLAIDGVVRRDITTSFGTSSTKSAGTPTTIVLTVVDATNGCSPMPGAAVYLWHCTPEGGYSMYSSGIEDENFFRGVQVADADGRLAFDTFFPGCYDGRWPHAHFEVYSSLDGALSGSGLVKVSQLAFPAATCEAVYAAGGDPYRSSVSNLDNVSLEGDGVFGDDGGVDELGTVSGDPASALVVELTVGIDPAATPTLGAGGR